MKLLLALVALSCAAWPQTQGPANAHYQTAEDRLRLARALSNPARDRRQRPAELVRALKIHPGSRVVDLGAGSGYMEPYLSAAVGPHGQVIAEDVRPEFLAALREQVARHKLTNVRAVRGTATDPRIPAGWADLILLLDVYHHLDDPPAMLGALRRSLAPQGRLAVVDYYRRAGAVPGLDTLEHIRAGRDQVIREVQSAGFCLIGHHDHIPGSQYVATFRATH